MYMHFSCRNCSKVYAVPVTQDPIGPVHCTTCDDRLPASALPAKKPRPKAIVMPAAALSRRSRDHRQAVKRTQESREKILSANRQKFMSNRPSSSAASSSTASSSVAWWRADDSDEDSDSDSNDDGDNDYIPTLSHLFNLRMRLTKNAYAPRGSDGRDSTYLMKANSVIRGKHGRGDLPAIMKKHLGWAKPSRCTAWRYAGTTNYSKNKFTSSEWCHLIADSLGGPSTGDNLVAASFSANTYMAAIEAMLQSQSALSLEVIVHCSAKCLAEWIEYNIHHKGKGKSYPTIHIDALAKGFCDQDLLRVQTDLQTWLKSVGIDVKLTP